MSALTSQGQGFYAKPTFGYGLALNKQDIYFSGRYVESVNYNVHTDHGEISKLIDERHTELVPLGKGKLFSLELGYESKKNIYFSLGLTLGILDRFTTHSFYNRTLRNNHYTHEKSSRKQIVSPVYYGIEPGFGLYSYAGKYRLQYYFRGFIGHCRIRIIEDEFYESLVIVNGQQKNNAVHILNNRVLSGSTMIGGILGFGVEKALSDRSSIGLNIEYRSQVYAPTIVERRNIKNYYHVMGSVIPNSVDRAPSKSTIDPMARRTYLFESIAIGISWKRYLTTKKE